MTYPYPEPPDDDRAAALDRIAAARSHTASIDWKRLQLDYPTWKLEIGGSPGVTGPGTVDYQARRGGVVLHSESIRGLRRELAAQPARPPEDWESS